MSRDPEKQKKYFAKWYSNPKNKLKHNARSREWARKKGRQYFKDKYIYKKKPFEERFWSYVDVKKYNQCWEWKRAKYPQGYGRFGKNYAHRLAYEFKKGNIPLGLCVFHSCDNPSCVNPKHLWLGTTMDNIKDRDNKGRGRYGK